MKLAFAAFSVALCLTVTSAASSLDVASVISSFFPSSTPHIPASKSTALASALHSVDASWRDSKSYTSAIVAIYSAAPFSVQASIDLSGYYYEDIITQTWYSKMVPKAVQTAVNKEILAIDRAGQNVLGTATSTGGVGEVTGVALAGLMAVVGAVVAL